MNKKNKKKILIAITLGVLVIALISIMIKDTHAFYNSETTPIQIFKAKIGNFKPIINSFYIKENNIQPKYTNQNINTVYLTWGSNNKNINEMCITEGDINSCSWQAINTSTQYTFANNEEGTKIVKGYIRDKAGNKSIEKSDTIIYDKTAPTIDKVEATNTTENSITISVTANQDTSGIDKYCYATSQTGPYTCKSESTNQYNNLEGGTEYTFWIYLKDKAGNGIQNNATQYKFSTKSKLAKDYLKDKDAKNTLQDDAVDGMYRYKGTATEVTNNYICFGTTDTYTCKNTPETYMYRIIGITSAKNDTLGIPSNSLKLIKAIPSSTSQVWHINIDDTKWDASDIKTYLNETFYKATFVTEATKIPDASYWESIILSHSWYNVDYTSVPNAEPTSSHTDASKIGLMYATDYKNSGSNNTNNWLHLRNGWSGNPTDKFEWSLSRYGITYGFYNAWVVNYDGYLSWNYLMNLYVVRPVFYVSPNITLTGEGTTTDPFIIHS